MLTDSKQLIWITGGGTGIGRATALAFAALGHRVVVSGRRLEPLQAVCDKARQQGLGDTLGTLAFDVTDSTDTQRAFEELCCREGVPDLVMLSAGNHQPMPARELSVEACRALMEVNYFGILNVLEVVLPAMRKRGLGTLALVSSVAGYRGLPTAGAYGGSKAAVINLAESLACELNGTGIDLRLINPGFVRTPLTDRNEFEMPCLIEPEEAAEAIIKGLKGSGFEICFPTRFAMIMKLMRLLPYRLYFSLIKRKTGL
ncbi:SDR family NAD(P)-dependent oxidoreductase [Marinobacterium lutimaris]|uniref:Short-chain dehydrogenase n=1 Tax=Marinobacterium lutimaris TaxID=568106 RepID=A0A1H5ZER0_9GAMM|nr:SDR family NAD(P)-dependent oxidoreductase [Marinobacterium lutimaris]SEG34117.1 Short-chain dehydrogenase [Marinobacterium lutimaris]